MHPIWGIRVRAECIRRTRDVRICRVGLWGIVVRGLVGVGLARDRVRGTELEGVQVGRLGVAAVEGEGEEGVVVVAAAEVDVEVEEVDMDVDSGG